MMKRWLAERGIQCGKIEGGKDDKKWISLDDVTNSSTCWFEGNSWELVVDGAWQHSGFMEDYKRQGCDCDHLQWIQYTISGNNSTRLLQCIVTLI